MCGNNIIKHTHTHTNRVQNEREKKIEIFFYFTFLYYNGKHEQTHKQNIYTFIHSLMMSNREKYIKKKKKKMKKVFWCLVSLSPDIIIQLYFFFARITPKHTHTVIISFNSIRKCHTHTYQINFFSSSGSR